jgi:hypothetical protein
LPVEWNAPLGTPHPVQDVPPSRMPFRQHGVVEVVAPRTRHADPLHHSPGPDVLRGGVRHDLLEPERRETELQSRPRGFRRITAVPVPGVKLVVSDAHGGLKPALDARLTGMRWQRCQFHLMKNALSFVSKPSLKPEVVASLRAVFDAPDRSEVERHLEIAVKKYRATAPGLADSLEVNVPQGLTNFARQ